MKIPDFLLSEPLGFHLPSLAAWLNRYERLQERMGSAAQLRVAMGPESEPHMLSLADFVNQRRDYQVTPEGIAMIHANDVLSRTSTKFDQMLGETHYNALIGEMGMASEDSQVRGIFLDISSPGGSAVGAPEAAAAVAAAAQRKPVVSYVETIGASAAYYLTAGASAIVASPSAVVGSIGTIAMFTDISDMLAKFGVNVQIITPRQSDLKASGNMVRPMTDPEREFLQQRTEALNADFTSFVKSNRPDVTDASLRGQWFSGSEAAGLGLVDQIGSRGDALTALEALIVYGDALG